MLNDLKIQNQNIEEHLTKSKKDLQKLKKDNSTLKKENESYLSLNLKFQQNLTHIKNMEKEMCILAKSERF